MKKIVILFALLLCWGPFVSAQWTVQKSNVTSGLFGVRFISPKVGWIVGQNGTFLGTTDGGASWNQLASPTGSNLNKVFFIDSLNGWIVGDYNAILSTTDGGQSWQWNTDNSTYMADYYGVFGLVSNNQIICWLAGGRSYTGLSAIEESSEGSGQWYPQYIGFSGRLVRIFFLNESLGWAVGDSGLILSTMNGGLSWNRDSSQTYSGLNDIMFFDSQVGLCVGDNGLIMKSTDGGKNWNVVQSTPGSIFFKLFLQGDSVAYAAGGPNSTILKSTDRGDAWTSQAVKVPPGTTFEDIYFINSSEGWAVGNGGVIVHTTNSGMSPPPVPVLASPVGTTCVPRKTRFMWNSSINAVTYRLQVASFNTLDSTGGFIDANVVFDTALVDTTAKIFNPLTANTIYYWHVSAADTAGASDYSTIEVYATGNELDGVYGSAGIPKDFALSQNFPNPFNPTTVINYQLPENSFVILKVFDILGREVATLVNERQNAGYYNAKLDASNLPSGVYFYRLKAGSYVAAKRLLVLK